MPAAKTTPAKKAAEAVNAERSLEFRGVRIALPSVLPASFAFDLAQIQGEAEAEEAPFGAIFSLITSIISREDFTKVRDALGNETSEDGGVAILMELLAEIVGEFGATEGE